MSNKNIESIFRLSPSQEGILYQCLKEPDQGYYHSQFSCCLSSLKDAEKWHQIWAELVKQHGSLRTFFTWEKRDQPLQVVRERVSLPWQTLDWRESTPEEQTQKWIGLKSRDKDLGFNLSKAPLARCALARVSSEEYWFLFSFHHILLDGWSQRLLFEQAVESYNACLGEDSKIFSSDKIVSTKTKASTESSQPASFERFIQWLSVQDEEQSLAYWSDYLSGFSTPTHLGKNTDGFSSSASTSIDLQLSQLESTAVFEFVKRNQVTLNNLLVGALALLISQETGKDDVVFGTTFSGRPADLPDCVNTVGMFINTLPVRTNIPRQESVLTWLKRLQSELANSLQHSHSALNRIQKSIDLDSTSGLFDTILVIENLPAKRQQEAELTEGLVVDRIHYEEYSHYPLAILVDLSNGINLIAVYQPNAIESEKVNQILDNLRHLIVMLIQDPRQTIESFTGILSKTHDLTDQPCTTVLEEQNVTGIHQYIEKAAERYPQKLALVGKANGTEESLNYAQLNDKANQLALHLIGLGFGHHSALAVYLERGNASVISFLAILKTGAAYIPLDSTHPEERIALILSDLDASEVIHNFAVLTDAETTKSLSQSKMRCINIDDKQSEIGRLPSHNPNVVFDSNWLAYVIYTSGSTGEPKGVMVSHGSLINSTLARESFYGELPDVFLLLSSLATDSSIAGIYWTLCTGQTLVVAESRAEQNLVNLANTIQRFQVTHLLCIPSLYFLLLENVDVQKLSTLKTAIVAGEACAPHVIEQHLDKLSKTKLFNEYGPSEFTVWATACQLNDWHVGNSIPIGQGIANSTLYVVDEFGQLAEHGSVGELYLTGPNLAQGYLNDELKTQQKFVRNEFENMQSNSQILYRTGDLVRYCDEVNLEYIGRTDNQIKIRGNRIEPEEVERALNSHPDILEALLVMENNEEGARTPAEIANDLSKLDPQLAEQILREVIASDER